jgi:hypothetical protein
VELAVWLPSLGLEQYEAAFRDNAITSPSLGIVVVSAIALSNATRSGLRVVYGRLRHARSEGREGVAGGIGGIALETKR